MASGPIITSWQIDGGNVETVSDFIFLVSKINVGGDCSHKIKRCLLFERMAMRNLDSILKSSDLTLPTKIHIVKAMALPAVMYRCENWIIKKAGWVPKSWCFQIVVLEKTLESPLDCKEIRLVNPKGNQPWIFIGRTDVEAEASTVLWPPDAKSQLTGKHPDTRKDWHWSWSSNTLVTWFEELTPWKRLMLGKIESRRRGG